MKPEKDIGEFIKSKIDESKITPNDQVWGKINESLDKKDKNRRIVYLLLLLIGLPMIIGFLWFSIPSDESGIKTPQQNETIVEKTAPINPSETRNQLNILEKEQDSVTPGKKVLTEVSDQSERDVKTVGSKTSAYQDAHISNSNRSKSKSMSTSKEAAEKLSIKDPYNTIKSSAQASQQSEEKGQSTEQKSNVEDKLSIQQSEVEDNLNNQTDSTEVSIDSLSISDNGKKKKLSKMNKEKKEKETENIETENSDQKIWGVGLVAAGEYFDSFHSGSMLDHRFDEKKTKGEIHFQYGVSLKFKITERFEVSYGASMVKFGYTTILDHPNEALNISAVYSNSIPEHVQFVENASSIDIKQQISYVELPLQMSYRIIQNKIGLEALLGISTFILTEDHVDLIDESGNILKLGGANNLSKLNFSFNAGIGPYYEFSDRLKFGLMPMVKYHIKPLSKNDYQRKTNFSLGVYGTLNYYFDL